ncbi:MAG TPA: SRPBCC family protein [Solirubrobacterales bacterium]
MPRISGSASAEIGAPVEEVWVVVEDVLTAPDWQGGLVAMSALERDAEERPALVEAKNDLRVRHITTQVRFRYEPPTRLSWTQEKGDLKSLTGSWDLKDLGDGQTRATYSLDADPGRVLGMLVRGPAEAAILAGLVKARPGELKLRIENA